MENEDTGIVPFVNIEESGIDLNAAVAHGQKMAALLKQMGIKEATFDSGAYFNHDSAASTTTLAADGIMMEQRRHTTSVVFRNSGSTEKEAFEEVKDLSTQKALGAFSGKSQSWASRALGHESDEE
jgi:hypothetical protein